MLHTHTACDEVDVGGGGVVPDYKRMNMHTLHMTRWMWGEGGGGGSARLQICEHTHTACDNIYALFVL